MKQRIPPPITEDQSKAKKSSGSEGEELVEKNAISAKNRR